MATESGSATDYLDLMAKVRDFLTTNAALVAANQEWEVVGGVATGPLLSGDFVSLKAPGLAGTDEILMSLQATSNPSSGIYNIVLRGHTFYDITAPNPNPAGSSKPVDILLGNTAMNYWIVANGRRFVLVAKFNATYEWMYGGFILPHHLPDDWAYPLLIGGSSDGSGLQPGSNAANHSAFWRPGMESSSVNVDVDSSCYMFTPANAWRTFRNIYNSIQTSLRGPQIGNYNAIYNQRWRRTLDDQAWVEPIELIQIGNDYTGDILPSSPEGGCNYGVLDGVYYTPAFGATAEQTAVIDGKNFIFFSNVRRVADGNFAALLWE